MVIIVFERLAVMDFGNCSKLSFYEIRYLEFGRILPWQTFDLHRGLKFWHSEDVIKVKTG